MKKRIYIMLVLALMIVLPSHAVLKEKNIENTLSLLRLNRVRTPIWIDEGSARTGDDEYDICDEQKSSEFTYAVFSKKWVYF
mgnify:CR=1 FL=1